MSQSNSDDDQEDEKVVLEKMLSESEKSRYWIHAKVAESCFPSNENFELKRGNKTTEAWLDNYGRLRIGSRGFQNLGIRLDKSGSIRVKIFRTSREKSYKIQVVEES